MRVTFRLLTVALLLLSGMAAVGADELYVRNQPFKGTTAGSGSGIMAEAEPLLKLLELDYKIDGNQLSVADKSLTLQEGMVSVKALSDAVGGRLVVNDGLNTVDFYLPTAVASKSEMPQKPPVVEAQQARAGAAVNLDNELTANKKNIVYFGANW